MKMVKSLLLGSAAGFVAVAGAQAADLPVKAKAVEYVKICSLYGAGFYYIPGTDICMKVGGYVRAEGFYNFGASGTTGIYNTPPSGQQDRVDGHDFLMRTRTYAAFDTRQQTQYGVVRTFLNVGANYDSPAGAAISMNRAFIQFAGFTVGTASSFYDYFQGAATSYLQAWTSDTGDGGWKVVGYTHQFGNGLSATIAAEEPRRTSVVNTGFAAGGSGGINPNDTTVGFTYNNPFVVGALPTSDMIKIRFPDIVANLRLDQAWGGLQVMGALHDASGGYYGTNAGGSPGNWNFGHPSDKLGWAAGVGLKINTPMISQGDYLQAQGNYAVGATKYTAHTPSSASPFMINGNSMGLGFFTDGVYCGGLTPASSASVTVPNIGCPGGNSSVELTTAWGINVAYEHFWTPALRTSLVYSTNHISYNSNATLMIASAIEQNATGACGSAGNFAAASNTTKAGLTTAPAMASGTISNLTNCNSDFSYWSLGSRTQWNLTKDFYMGVDVMYSQLKTAYAGLGSFRNSAGTYAPSAATYTISDQSNWAFRYRVHRDIAP